MGLEFRCNCCSAFTEIWQQGMCWLVISIYNKNC